MKFLQITTLLALLAGFLNAEEKPKHHHGCSASDPEKLATVEAYKKIFAAAEAITIYEGLPHQYEEEELLKKELKRKDYIKLVNGGVDYPFYTPAVKATNADELRMVLSGPDCLSVYIPMKCGFHPDYCLKWKHDKITYHALVCFGCGQIVVMHDKIYQSFYFNDEKLKKLLAVYDLKRPKPEKAE